MLKRIGDGEIYQIAANMDDQGDNRFAFKEVVAILDTQLEADQKIVREIFEEIDTHSAKEQLPIRDGSHLIRIIPEDAYQALREKYLRGEK